MPKSLTGGAIKIRLFCLTLTLTLVMALAIASPASGEVRIKLSDINPGTETITLAPNGDFENRGTGWTRIGDMFADSAPGAVTVPPSTGQAIARAHIDNNATVGVYQRSVTLEGNTAYVLSAYMWDLGDINHHVDVIVVDLDDAGLGSPGGIWEGQLTLNYAFSGADDGYFIYSTFTTPPGQQTVTLRVFYVGLNETDDNWPNYPVAAMWDNIAITMASNFSAPLPPDPYQAPNSSPPSGAEDIDPAVVMSWDAPAGITNPAYDVYFGTNSVVSNNPEVATGQSETTFDPYGPDDLDIATNYYWRVDVVDNPNVHVGSTWTFATWKIAPIIGDFDYDRDVDINDLGTFAYCWLTDTTGDLNADFKVDFQDYSSFASNWRMIDKSVVDTSTLTDKVMCGYQGWFTCQGDGAGRGWFHYEWNGGFEPGKCSIDFWPDMSEMDADEKYPTAFNHADGNTAYVFSSYNYKTVLRHFKWMQDYGIDGTFVQRFAVETFHPVSLNHFNTVLAYCREGANRYGRAYAVMYDLSGMQANQMQQVMDDWESLVDDMKITKDPNDGAYLHHNGKPVVGVWGVGFNDNRQYTLAECAQLVNFLKNDPTYGGNAVMLGVPSGWRTLDWDSLSDPVLHDIILSADIVSPWTIGRYNSPASAVSHAQNRWQPDITWCQQNGKEYLPVVFPGFSWHNMFPASPLDVIPRLGGEFLWTQFVEAKRAGAIMIYQAMFDEMDEGTAIFKCTNDPPVGASSFLTYEGLPTDHYLWLVGMAGKMLRNEIDVTDNIPTR